MEPERSNGILNEKLSGGEEGGYGIEVDAGVIAVDTVFDLGGEEVTSPAINEVAPAATSTATHYDGVKEEAKVDDNEEEDEDLKLDLFSTMELDIFKTFVENYKKTGQITEKDAISLEFAFGQTIQQAFEILEKDEVNVWQDDLSERTLIEVHSRNLESYWIPPGYAECQCMAFSHAKKNHCKHILAAHIFIAVTPKENYKKKADEEMSDIYKSYFDNT